MARLARGMKPALFRWKGFPLSRMFRKNVPPIYPASAIIRKANAAPVSKRCAIWGFIFLNAVSFPKASIIRIKPQARMMPPGKPPPGVKCPKRIIFIPNR